MHVGRGIALAGSLHRGDRRPAVVVKPLATLGRGDALRQQAQRKRVRRLTGLVREARDALLNVTENDVRAVLNQFSLSVSYLLTASEEAEHE